MDLEARLRFSWNNNCGTICLVRPSRVKSARGLLGEQRVPEAKGLVIGAVGSPGQEPLRPDMGSARGEGRRELF